jgi:hypothetical protein
MSVADRAPWLLLVALAGCDLVLDLDARSGGDGTGAGGGAGDSGAGVGTSSGACESHARFAGGQLVRIEDDERLEMEDEFAIGARVRIDASAAVGGSGVFTGTVLSRVEPTGEKGFELVLVERDDDGLVYPELRLHIGMETCVCTSSLPLPTDAWVTLGAGYDAEGPGEDDASVFLDGILGCEASCDDKKVPKFHGVAAIGSASDGGAAYFRGSITDVSLHAWRRGEPIVTGCSGETFLSVSFDAAVGQAFSADCPGGIDLVLGASAEPGPDDPEVVTCP